MFKILASKVLKIKSNKIVRSSSSQKSDETFKNLFKSKKLKNKKFKIQTNIEATSKLIFLIFSIKKVFNQLKGIFTKILIF